MIGQPNLNSGTSNLDFGCLSPSANSLCDPVGVTVDSAGNLYVADTGNARVLEYNAPFAGCGSFPCVGPSANLVFGQGGDFTANSCDGAGLSASSLCFPLGVAVDSSGDLYVVDESDSRVLEYSSPADQHNR